MFIPKMENTTEKRIILFSGAGISQPSGISTFRDVDGLWENNTIEDICNEFTWKKNFEAVHRFYNKRRVELKNVEPNIAHKTIKNIVERYGKEKVYNITQNIDDLFERAEVDALHVHGELKKMECEACGNCWDIGYSEFNIENDRCPRCNSLKEVRPKVVFFNGTAPMYKYMLRAFEYAVNPDTIIVIMGTMGNVVSVEKILKGMPCKKILCNIEKSPYLAENIFDCIYYENIETAVVKIEKDIQELWK